MGKEKTKVHVYPDRIKIWYFEDDKQLGYFELQNVDITIFGDNDTDVIIEVDRDNNFICKKCGDEIKISDYDYKDANLYYSLFDAKICEACFRSGK